MALPKGFKCSVLTPYLMCRMLSCVGAYARSVPHAATAQLRMSIRQASTAHCYGSTAHRVGGYVRSVPHIAYALSTGMGSFSTGQLAAHPTLCAYRTWR
eukprot:2477376-Rhodomonas_salina.2